MCLTDDPVTPEGDSEHSRCLVFGSTPGASTPAQRCGLASITVIACESFKFDKRSHYFIDAHDETLPFVGMYVCSTNPPSRSSWLPSLSTQRTSYSKVEAGNFS